MNKDDLNISTMSLNRDRTYLVVGSRKEFRVLQLVKNPDEPNKYSKIEETVKYLTRKRNNLDQGIYDVQWNPNKSKESLILTSSSNNVINIFDFDKAKNTKESIY